MKKILLAFLLAFPGCGICPTQAERLTFEAISPEYLRYVTEDTSLSSDQKQRRYETVRSWEARLKAKESDDE